MFQISGISNEPLQNMTVSLPDGTNFQMTIYFMSMQQCWFLLNVTFGDFVLNSVKITTSPNFLYQWKNLIPFGLSCVSTDRNRDPQLLEDFSSGTCSLYVLSAQELEQLDNFLEYGSSQVF